MEKFLVQKGITRKRVLLIFVVGVCLLGFLLVYFLISKHQGPAEPLGSAPATSSASQPGLPQDQGQVFVNPVYELDKALIEERIETAKGYLLRMLDKERGGAHKYYYALQDRFENRLHTIYTSSLLYSLLKIYDYNNEEALWPYIDKGAEFILSMQETDPKSRAYGAFHYSLFLSPDANNDRKDNKFVVGTASKTIFTLLELYQRKGEKRFLESAVLAGDWLLTMQNDDGSMTSYIRLKDNGSWAHSTKESLLYNGQALSALSRLYRATGSEKYYQAAQKIAERHKDMVQENGCYLGDDYRGPNPISSSWVVLSLLDFYKTKREKDYKDLVLRCSQELLKRQRTDQSDALEYGRYAGSGSTSGNGWLAEVMTEVYNFCLNEQLKDCEKYKTSIVNSINWLSARVYTEQNSGLIPNPQRAEGGFFWNKDKLYVRTDSVCHGINAFVGIAPYLREGVLLSLPQH